MENELKKDTKKYFSKLGLMFLLGCIVIFAVQRFIPQLINLIFPNLIIGYDAYFLSLMLPLYIIGIPVLILLVKQVPAAPVTEKKKMSVGHWIITFLMCYACIYLSNIVGLIITYIIGLIKNAPVQNTIVNITSLISPVTAFFIMVICAPIAEEIVFRKLLVDRASKYGEKVAILLSGFMFGLFHGNLNQFVYAFTLGCFLAFIYAKTRNVLHVILIHMGINFMGSTLGQTIIEKSGYLDIAATLEKASSPEEIMQIMSSNITGIAIYVVYALFLLVIVIAGAVLLIVNRKKFTCSKGEIELPKGQSFSAVILNVGMILFSIFWIGMIIYQLFI
ncbi:MAG: CPBP family intramembrane metalloprotease [Lachnospiraceae bacterium]|nr:CPBP family intramembrane metalloprotease [Lachnospiraceae bacterium]